MADSESEDMPTPAADEAAETPAPKKSRARRAPAVEAEAEATPEPEAPELPASPLVVALYDAGGKRSGEVELPGAVFGVEPNQPVMHQALLRQLANARQGTAATKTRGMVSGGGVKPYRQKGTGKARHGSSREPSMVGGGTVFGPQPRSFRQRMPRKMRRLALRSALSVKATERRITVLENLQLEEPKTSTVVGLLRQIGVKESALVVVGSTNHLVSRSVANVPWIKAILATNLNLYDLFTHDDLILARDAIERLEEILTPPMAATAGGAER